jgi:hypothetical protein
MLNKANERTDIPKLNNRTNPLQEIKIRKEVMNGTKGVK